MFGLSWWVIWPGVLMAAAMVSLILFGLTVIPNRHDDDDCSEEPY